MTVLSIGYYDFLLPDEVDGGAIVKALSQALACRYEYYKTPPVVVLEDEVVEIQLRVVPKKARVVRKMEGEMVDVVEKKPRPRPMKAQSLSFPPDAKLLTAPAKSVPALNAPKLPALPPRSGPDGRTAQQQFLLGGPGE